MCKEEYAQLMKWCTNFSSQLSCVCGNGHNIFFQRNEYTVYYSYIILYCSVLLHIVF
jgi:hypothetical protein